MAARWSMARPDDHRMSAAGNEADVRQDPDRQPRRDRPARGAGLPRDGHHLGRRAFHRRCRRHARADGGRKRVHRTRALVRKLSQQGRDHLGLRDHRRAGRASRLWLPVRECRLRQALEDHDITFIGPSAEHIRIMGDKITAKETAKALGIPVVPGSDGGVPISRPPWAWRRASVFPSSSRLRPAAAGAA